MGAWNSASCPCVQLGHVFILQSCQQEQTSQASTTSWFNDLRKQGFVGNSSLATASWEASLPRKQYEKCRSLLPACFRLGRTTQWHKEIPVLLCCSYLVPGRDFFCSTWCWVKKKDSCLWGDANSSSLLCSPSLCLPFLLVQQVNVTKLQMCPPPQPSAPSSSQLHRAWEGTCQSPQSPHLLFIFRQVRSDAPLHIGTHTSYKSVCPGHRACRVTPLLEGGSGGSTPPLHLKQDHCQY